MNRLEKLPVPILPTFVGAATLSNVYAGLGYDWIRHITMWAAAVVLLCYIVKIIRFPKVFAGEYNNTVPASLYAGFTMVTMILGSYIFEYQPAAGKAVFLAGLCIHAVHILVFTVRNVVMARNINTFVPSWFVTYNGIMVSCVVGGAMGIAPVLKVIVYYGIAVYFIIIPIMIYRLFTVEIKDAVYHTMAVILAPSSLCLVSYLNVIENPNAALVYILYACVLASLIFVISKLPKFFAYSFVPGFAGLTFPMAIGVVASNKMAGFMEGIGSGRFSNAAAQAGGIQIYLTSMLVGFVLLNFFMMFLKTERKG